jgi:hypothetical protein
MSTSPVTGLDQPVAVPDLEWVNFFNGRLLTGEDLAQEQVAGRIARRLVGRALGSGVADGLSVSLAAGVGSASRPVLTIDAGLAVCPRGDVLELASTTQLELAAAPGAPTADGAAGFSTCVPTTGGTYTAATGVFVLAIGPSSAPAGRAPVSGLGNEGAACNVAFAAEGVQFHLFRIALPTSLNGDAARLRNRLAHLALGTDDSARIRALTDPLAADDELYGLLDRLPPGCLGDDRVPLALVHWTAQGVEFVDRWAVRRRIAAPPAGTRFPVLMGDRRRAEAEAAFEQFQQHIEELRGQLSAPQAATAAAHFDFLPPAGVLPAGTPGGPPGFSASTFFGAQASSELAAIDAAQVPALLHDSLWHEPIAVGGSRRIQIYAIREHELALSAGEPVRPAVLFATETLSYRGVARFGRARFGLSRFSPRVM